VLLLQRAGGWCEPVKSLISPLSLDLNDVFNVIYSGARGDELRGKSPLQLTMRQKIVYTFAKSGGTTVYSSRSGLQGLTGLFYYFQGRRKA